MGEWRNGCGRSWPQHWTQVCTASRPDCFQPRKEASYLYWIGSFTAGLNALENRKVCCPYREWKPVPTTAQPTAYLLYWLGYLVVELRKKANQKEKIMRTYAMTAGVEMTYSPKHCRHCSIRKWLVASGLGHFIPGERTPDNHSVGGWVGLRIGLDWRNFMFRPRSRRKTYPSGILCSVQ